MLLINDIFLIGFGVLAIGVIIAVVLKVQPFQIFFWGLVYIYIVIVFGIALFPIPYAQAHRMIPIPNNYILFKTIASALEMGVTRTALIQLCGNIVISVPYGIIINLTSKKKGLLLFLLMFLFPFVVETLQFIVGCIIGLNYRSFDVDDFILNIFGAYIGFVCSRIVLKPYKEKINKKIFSNR